METKIIIRMRGGLGNQLFILAFSYYVALNLNDKYEIVIDDREYNHYKIRNLEILNFINDSNLRKYEQSKDKSLFYDLTRVLFHVYQRFVPNYISLSKCLMNFGLFYSKRRGGIISGIKRSNIYVYGYFQDENIVHNVKKYIMDRMINHESKYIFEARYKYIAISVRCGQDYKNCGWPIYDESYFRKGIDYIIKRKYKNEKVKIIVFADEINYVRNWNLGVDVSYIEGYSPVEQIKIMMGCNDFVIANSSFSWWGAYLGCQSDSIVVVPKFWYSATESTENTLLLYDNCVIL